MRSLVGICLLAVTVTAAPVPKDFRKPPVIDLRDSEGTVLLAADDIEGYAGMSHVLTLAEIQLAKKGDTLQDR